MSDFTKLNRLERVEALNGASTKARAVWSLAHHALDRRGRMKLGGADWQAVLVRRLGVDTSERQWFYAGLRELERAGLASVVGDEFVLGGHAGAEEKPPKRGQPRADLGPTSDGPALYLPPTCDEPPTDLRSTSCGPLTDLQRTSDGPSADLRPANARSYSETVPRARDQNREEERREEEEGGRAAPSSALRMEASFVQANHDVIAAYRNGICDATQRRIPVAHGGRFEQAAELLAVVVETLPEAPDIERLALIRRAAAEAAADPEHRMANTPFAWFARNIGRYVMRATREAMPARTRIDEIEAAMAACEAERQQTDPGPKRDALRKRHFELQAQLRAARGAA